MAEVQKKAEWSELVNNNPQQSRRLLRLLLETEPLIGTREWRRRRRRSHGERGRGKNRSPDIALNWSSSSSRTWRAKTVEESSIDSATDCNRAFFFLFSIILLNSIFKNQFEDGQKKR